MDLFDTTEAASSTPVLSTAEGASTMSLQHGPLVVSWNTSSPVNHTEPHTYEYPPRFAQHVSSSVVVVDGIINLRP